MLFSIVRNAVIIRIAGVVNDNAALIFISRIRIRAVLLLLQKRQTITITVIFVQVVFIFARCFIIGNGILIILHRIMARTIFIIVVQAITVVVRIAVHASGTSDGQQRFMDVTIDGIINSGLLAYQRLESGDFPEVRNLVIVRIGIDILKRLVAFLFGRKHREFRLAVQDCIRSIGGGAGKIHSEILRRIAAARICTIIKTVICN